MIGKTPKPAAPPGKPALLSGGNPQIAKGHGDAPVQAWIAAAPGWKGDVARRLDALIERTVPGVKKAVKWNTPLYGVEEGAWFVNFHAFDRYLKVAFFRARRLTPSPRSPRNTRRSAISTSTKTTRSTRPNSPTG